jgi:pyruvate-ferredoxin/flavodoxin oxidoreductase
MAGELTPFVLHVAARTVATHALSIFGDHSDVMACRGTGFAMLASASPQEAHDLALVAHAATLRCRVPFLHFFDGFRTSHEMTRVRLLDDDDLRALLDDDLIAAHRRRALTPDRPVLRGTAQNPDVFFQAREACNPFTLACPDAVAFEMQRLAARTGRRYELFEYHGHPAAERVVVAMGSATQTVRATVDRLVRDGEKVGAITVRLYRPFAAERFVATLPRTVRRVAVLDRTKEPGSPGEPLFLDVVAALAGACGREAPEVVGGRYGLSSKELTPAMVRAVFDELGRDRPRRGFTVGITDDVSGTSLGAGPELDVLPHGVYQALFYGVGSDGTVGANKSTVGIIGEETDLHVQAYFVHDSRKAGAVTVSHLRFGVEPIEAPYLVTSADLVACHQFELLDRLDVVAAARDRAVFLLNAPHDGTGVWERLPLEVQQQVLEKRLDLWSIDAQRVAREAGLGGRINTVMQACFFALSEILPPQRALDRIKASVAETYARKGQDVVRRNVEAVEAALAHLHRVEVPALLNGQARPPSVPATAPEFVQRVTAAILAGHGDQLPVSAFPPDGTWPVGTARWEKRNLADEIPVWIEDLCIQCNKCVLACPHAAIRAKLADSASLAAAPEGTKSLPWADKDMPGLRYLLQVAPEDCTGCRACVSVCPAREKADPRRKALAMVPQRPLREMERRRFEFFLSLPELDRASVSLTNKGSQLLEPLFEFSGACAGCGETPYLKLLTQLFGDRLLIANATGCSSIFGGNLPTTPYTTNRDGRGPAWCNSLFEDNAELGLGMRLGLDAHRARAERLLGELAPAVGSDLATSLLAGADARDETGIAAQRERIARLRSRLREVPDEAARQLEQLADYLVRKSVWLVGGDGWAYDIGFGGLDHVLASGRDVNVLVLDTGVYSNTGGQQSKATPLGAAAKFASAGKALPKKDLGLMAMSYGHVYVAQVAYGARDAQLVRAMLEAERHPGPSLVIAYAHCIAHGYDMALGPEHQRLAVEAGLWPLFTVDPARADRGEPALVVDAGATPKRSVRDFTQVEMRYRVVEQDDPQRFELLQRAAQAEATRRMEIYRQLAAVRVHPTEPDLPAIPPGDPKDRT